MSGLKCDNDRKVFVTYFEEVDWAEIEGEEGGYCDVCGDVVADRCLMWADGGQTLKTMALCEGCGEALIERFGKVNVCRD